MTYTVVAFDKETGDIALGTVSHSNSVLAKILTKGSNSKEHVLIASQAFSSPELGGECARHALGGGDLESISSVCRQHDGGEYKQVVMVTSNGELAAFTGGYCIDFSGHQIDRDAKVAIAGNMLSDGGVLEAAHSAFILSSGSIDERILYALEAAGNAGGDLRGDRSAGLVFESDRIGGSFDIRVDDHDTPLAELRRLRDMATRRSILSTCYEWITRGCPEAVAQHLINTLRECAVSSEDPDLRIWQFVVEHLAGREPGRDATLTADDEVIARKLIQRFPLAHGREARVRGIRSGFDRHLSDL
ncbi:DUF1028 domain-containing protein [Homoserinimonas sp. OAct 916]|uniref:DUF1028 domain-containing protein n=1 Tax=Homoserinimonas sp. OAct 916 TaxID=2211450 RepID=UPI0013008D2D|nr:DUF1028 domain-containing protein [Homoserinimonas sp. OAct 916]